MTTGGTASAFVEMLEKMERAALSEKNVMQAKVDKSLFEYHQLVARLDELRVVLAEAIKLRNAVINEWDYRIKRDGTVDVTAPPAQNAQRALSSHQNDDSGQTTLFQQGWPKEVTGEE